MDHAPRLSFSKENPKLQIAWDSTSLGHFKTCPRKYQLAIVEGWRGRGESLHLRYGQLYHRALEVYDHKRAEGQTHDEAMRACLRDLAEGCQDIVIENPITEGPLAGQVNNVPRRVWWSPDDPNKTVPNLFRTVVWYLERFKDDVMKTVILENGKPAVELSFAFETDYQFYTGEFFSLCGHMDRVVEFQEKIWIQDRKTTKTTIGSYWFEKFNPDNQMTLYTVAGKVVLNQPVKGVIIDGAQIAVGFSRFERGFSLRTEDQLKEWLDNTVEWIRDAEACAVDNFWPMNDTACHQYGGCPFRGACNKDPKVREVYLKADFHQNELWDPLKARGDI